MLHPKIKTIFTLLLTIGTISETKNTQAVSSSLAYSVLLSASGAIGLVTPAMLSIIIGEITYKYKSLPHIEPLADLAKWSSGYNRAEMMINILEEYSNKINSDSNSTATMVIQNMNSELYAKHRVNTHITYWLTLTTLTSCALSVYAAHKLYYAYAEKTNLLDDPNTTVLPEPELRDKPTETAIFTDSKNHEPQTKS